MKPRLLDLFCGAGGCTKGYQDAGFHVFGVDNVPQPRYCGDTFAQRDALEFLEEHIEWILRGAPTFDAIHASPPCQAHTSLNAMWNAREHVDLVGPTRELLIATGLPYVIENVEGAPLIEPVRICGSSLGLGTETHELRRHRLFETNWPLMAPPCAHSGRPVIGVYGDHIRDRRRSIPAGELPFSAEDGKRLSSQAMGLPETWTHRERSQAIPPLYTELVGHQLISHLRTADFCPPPQNTPNFSGSLYEGKT